MSKKSRVHPPENTTQLNHLFFLIIIRLNICLVKPTIIKSSASEGSELDEMEDWLDSVI